MCFREVLNTLNEKSLIENEQITLEYFKKLKL